MASQIAIMVGGKRETHVEVCNMKPKYIFILIVTAYY